MTDEGANKTTTHASTRCSQTGTVRATSCISSTIALARCATVVACAAGCSFARSTRPSFATPNSCPQGPLDDHP